MKTKITTLLGAGLSLLVAFGTRSILVASAAMITLVGLAPPVAGQMIDLGTLSGDSASYPIAINKRLNRLGISAMTHRGTEAWNIDPKC